MKRFIKYGVVPAVTFLFLLISTIMVLPVVVNVQRHIPEIEEKLSNVAGRPISIGSDVGLTLFPWLNISFSDLRIDNPSGYISDGFVKIESFEARVKLLPLLKKEVQISRLIASGLEVNLEKRSDGRANWNLTQESRTGETIATSFSQMSEWSLPEGFSIALFAITDGTINWQDRTQNSHHRIDDLMLLMSNLTQNDPVATEFKASNEGKSIALEGELGPIGRNPGRGELPVDFAVSLNNNFSGQINGKLIDLIESAGYELELDVPSFSARELFYSLNDKFPIATTDPTTFRSVEFDIMVKGDKKHFSVEQGKVKIDETLSDILLVLNDFDHPELNFALDIDRLDLDRYLPPKVENYQEHDNPALGGQGAKDSCVWRKINLAGALRIKELRVGGGTVTDIDGRLRGADGIFAVDSTTFTLYQGQVQTNLTVDFQNTVPQTSIDLKAQGIQAKPFLHDFMAKDFLSGTVDTDIRFLFSGNHGDVIQKSLYADGTLTVKEGTIEGIDMTNAVTNIDDSLSGSEASSPTSRTDFSELKSILTIRNGLVDSRETTITSPQGNVLVSGTADLVKKQLELIIEPETTEVKAKEKGNEQSGSEGSVPFSLSGNFTQPTITIDAQYLSPDEFELPGELVMQNMVEENYPSPVEGDLKNLVGKTLIDPAVVAQRFGLEPELIQKKQVKKQLMVGSGKVRVGQLREESSWR